MAVAVHHSADALSNGERTKLCANNDKLMCCSKGALRNNPFNIRYYPSNEWIGSVYATYGYKDGFEAFSSVFYGVRAAVLIVMNYNRLYGIDTIRGIVARFAPPAENDTESYARFVSMVSGIGIDDPIDFGSVDEISSILYAMHLFESGCEVVTLSYISMVVRHVMITSRGG